MTLISIVNNKGGSSKSSTAIHLAQFVINQGYSLAFIDCDRQESSAKWLEALELDIPVHCVTHVDEFEDIALDLVHEYDCVVVDTPSNDEEIQRAAIALSDYVFVPTQASSLDLDGCLSTVKKIKLARKKNRDSNIEAFLFLTRITKNSRVLQEAIEYCKELEHIKFLDTAIPNTVRLSGLMDEGKTAYQLPQQDLAELYTTIFSEVL